MFGYMVCGIVDGMEEKRRATALLSDGPRIFLTQLKGHGQRHG